MGSKEPFDCAVCLCEFSKRDKLRSLPLCSHAFHIHCIDTLLLSNSSCPLSKGTLYTLEFSVENPVFDFHDDSREEDDHVATNGKKRDEKEVGENSNSNLDARRCFSMGSYEYVVGNSELQLIAIGLELAAVWEAICQAHVSVINGIFVNYWACINFSRTVPDSAAQSFCHQLVQMCQESGMEFKSESVVPIYSARPDQVKKALRHMYTATVKQTWRKRVGIAYYHSP
ncbi:unnamed protein product [Lactuca saligna]|uniref:RING-type domain-containing protein n=1 Tax=Lactuca saligna TaxID=75948 RepID=A0AA35YTV4_LACSI|nr:unnamed protein product [Lactuca saligna]